MFLLLLGRNDRKEGTSNLIIILPAMGVQGSRPNCTKSTKQYVYTSNQLRSIGKQYKYGNKPQILPFAAIRQIRDLCLNKKKNTRKTNTGIHLNKLELTTKT